MKNLTQGNIYKNFILFAIPMVFAALLSQGYNMIDTIIAGRFLGSDGLAAIGTTAAFISFASGFFWGFASGASIFTASLFGAQEYSKIKSAVYHNLGAMVAMSALFCTVVIVFCDDILRLLRVDPEIFDEAKIYFVIYMGGLFLILLNNSFVHIMNSFGLSSFPLFMSILSAILNILGNILAVAVFDFGIAGIAWSTVLSALIVNICYFLRLRACFCEIGVRSVRVKFDKRILRKIFSYAMPTALQQEIMYTSTMLISPLVNGLGSAASASYTVIMRIYEINAGIYQNSAKTLSNYAAHCRGSRVPVTYFKKGVRVGLLQGLIFLSAPLLICSLLAEEVSGLFFPSEFGGEALDYTIIFAQVYLPFIVFNVINNLFHAFYRGTASMKLLVSLTAIGSASRLIFTIALLKYGMHGVFMGWVLSWIFEAVTALSTYLLGMWKKDAISDYIK